MTQMTPQEIVHELDKHIVGQDEAKRAVAIALRNRWRRQQVSEPLRQEITPKNILMIGPTGVGKTEIARRLAGSPTRRSSRSRRPSLPRSVTSAAMSTPSSAIWSRLRSRTRASRRRAKCGIRPQIIAEERMLDALLPPAREVGFQSAAPEADGATRQKFRKKLREGELDDREIEIEVAAAQAQMEIFAPPGMEDLTSQIQGMFQNLGTGRKRSRKLKIKDAMKLLVEEEAAKLVNDEDLKLRAIANVEQNGIVFIDEIDKIAGRSEMSGADVSRQGVQRDLLPLVEGTTVSTKYGMIKTDHILFIASGAFHLSRPSDLIPEMQGRFPIRVELQSLSVADFEQILTNTDACLTRQYEALLATEGVTLEFRPDAITRLAEIAWR